MGYSIGKVDRVEGGGGRGGDAVGGRDEVRGWEGR